MAEKSNFAIEIEDPIESPEQIALEDEIRGKVDYVTSDDDGTMYVSVNDKQYKVSEIDSVVDSDYYNAVTIVETFNAMVAKLPLLENITIKDETDITNALNVFNSMDTYTRSFVKEDTVKLLESIANRLADLKKAKEESDKTSETNANEEAKTDSEQTEKQTEAAATSGAASTGSQEEKATSNEENGDALETAPAQEI